MYIQFSSVQSLSRVQLFVTPWRAAWGWFPPRGYRHSANLPGSRLLTPASCHWPAWRVCFHFVRPLTLVCAACETEHWGRHHQAAWGTGRVSGSLFSLGHLQPLVWGWTARGPPAAWLGVWVQQDLLTPLHPFLIVLGTWKLHCLFVSLSSCCCHHYYFFFFLHFFLTKMTNDVIQLACPKTSNLDWERAWYQILGGKCTIHMLIHNAILYFLLFLFLRCSVINGNMSLFSTKSFFSNLYNDIL